MTEEDSCLNDIPIVLDRGCTVGDSPDCRVGSSEDPRGDVEARPLHAIPRVGVEQPLEGDVAVVEGHPSPLLPPGAFPPTFITMLSGICGKILDFLGKNRDPTSRISTGL